ncbi:MAG: hypothetical protein QUS09_08720, partial [Methanotrichaceae archaeon]|nr:hypothetical protein [Methanotrichaceae archaeon]
SDVYKRQALDSEETREILAGLCIRHKANKVILNPTASSAWEYDCAGNILKKEVPIVAVSDSGRRLIGVPEGKGFWKFGVYDEIVTPEGHDDVAITHFREELPE